MSEITINYVAQHYRRLSEYHQKEAITLSNALDEAMQAITSQQQQIDALKGMLQGPDKRADTLLGEAIEDCEEGKVTDADSFSSDGVDDSVN